ncbi:hypothetical protein [Halomonas rhizosphaerae]|uniref:Uncharacterized protein n=1 Tax=Halomonas rhizosphaerae TaxID=3043296 RepID=A0ABT6UXE5_9GAMM|nr:hypothetical protein [Halomonas rhizosphaerae]MDI5890640.1 hypothetical protein [Halomonas rhizosphaerae]
MIRRALICALLILVVAAAGARIVHALGWMAATDRQVERASLEDYCTSVAIWGAQVARGVPLNRRTGHPDYDKRAAEDCPGMRPAAPAITTERQLARN